MTKNLILPAAAAVLAIAITSVMDLNGLGQFSALPLAGLIALFWFLQRLTRREAGFTLGRVRDYAWALLYPAFVLGFCLAGASLSGQAGGSERDWGAIAGVIATNATVGTLAALITEEGFFRGTLWAGFARAEWSAAKILVVTAVLFMLWHVSWAVFAEEGRLPVDQVPVYLANVVLLGLAWGLMRHISGSVVVPSLSHGVWNAFLYPLFGSGEESGVLEIANVAAFDPERGYLGLILNGLFVLALWRLEGRAKVPGE